MSNTANSATHDKMAGKWKQSVGSAKIFWANLTDDEILKTEGQAEKLTGIVQERYGIAKDVADKQVADFMASLKD